MDWLPEFGRPLGIAWDKTQNSGIGSGPETDDRLSAKADPQVEPPIDDPIAKGLGGGLLRDMVEGGLSLSLEDFRIGEECPVRKKAHLAKS